MAWTHTDLVRIGGNWLRKTAGCSTVLEELCAHTGSGEKPDVIGWRSSGSYLIECKTSRADFLRDAKKAFRVNPARGMGKYRYYLVPRGTLKPGDLPARWGLLEVDDAGGVWLIAGKAPKRADNGKSWAFQERNTNGETAMLLSALSRAKRHMGADVFHTAIHTPFPRPEVERREMVMSHRKEQLASWNAGTPPIITRS